jgi:hypothetical protein
MAKASWCSSVSQIGRGGCEFVERQATRVEATNGSLRGRVADGESKRTKSEARHHEQGLHVGGALDSRGGPSTEKRRTTAERPSSLLDSSLSFEAVERNAGARATRSKGRGTKQACEVEIEPAVRAN